MATRGRKPLTRRRSMTLDEAEKRLRESSTALGAVRQAEDALSAFDGAFAKAATFHQEKTRQALDSVESLARVRQCHLGRLRKAHFLGRRITSSALRYLFGRNALASVMRICAFEDRRVDRSQDELALILEELEAPQTLQQLKGTAQAVRSALPALEDSQLDAAADVLFRQLDTYRTAIDLIGGIMAAQYDISDKCQHHYNEFEKLLRKDYLDFAREEDYPSEADAYNALEEVFASMKDILSAPRLAFRNICAVAGSFSSGKSSFLNSLIAYDEPEVLPTDITATTSIPTYILHVDDEYLQINVHNHAGGRMKIDREGFHLITHEFERNYRIMLKQIVDRASIFTPRLGEWPRIAFVDTPGYSNPAGRRMQTDEEIARRQILASRYLIWVIDCDKGALPNEDVEFIGHFLRKHPSIQRLKRPPIYFVLNKADKKEEQERLAILRAVVETAEKNEIPFFGVGLYSAHESRWYCHEGWHFKEFLAMMNSSDPPVWSLKGDIESVMNGYIHYHEDEGNRLRDAKGLINKVKLALHEDDRKVSKLVDGIEEHRKYIQRSLKHHEFQRGKAVSLCMRFTDCATEFIMEIERIGKS